MSHGTAFWGDFWSAKENVWVNSIFFSVSSPYDDLYCVCRTYRHLGICLHGNVEEICCENSGEEVLFYLYQGSLSSSGHIGYK